MYLRCISRKWTLVSARTGTRTRAYAELGTENERNTIGTYFIQKRFTQFECRHDRRYLQAVCSNRHMLLLHTTQSSVAAIHILFFFSHFFRIFHLILFDRLFVHIHSYEYIQHVRLYILTLNKIRIRTENQMKVRKERQRRKRMAHESRTRCRDVFYSIHMCTTGRMILIISVTVVVAAAAAALSSIFFFDLLLFHFTCHIYYLRNIYCRACRLCHCLCAKSSTHGIIMNMLAHAYVSICMCLTDETNNIHSFDSFAHSQKIICIQIGHICGDFFLLVPFSLFSILLRQAWCRSLALCVRNDFFPSKNEIGDDGGEWCFIVNIKFWLTTSLCVYERSKEEWSCARARKINKTSTNTNTHSFFNIIYIAVDDDTCIYIFECVENREDSKQANRQKHKWIYSKKKKMRTRIAPKFIAYVCKRVVTTTWIQVMRGAATLFV